MFSLIRWKNIAIVWLTIWLTAFALLPSDIFSAQLINLFLISLFISAYAAYGYIINDAFDLEIDAINRPQKASLQYSKKQLLGFGFIFVVLANMTLMGIRPLLPFTVISIICALQLWSYSKYFKCTPIMGNLVVSLFCAGVPFCLFFLHNHAEFNKWIWAYTIFALITTWLRELVKDMEDIEGDARETCQTFPVYAGFKKSKRLAIVLSLVVVAITFAGLKFLAITGVTLWVYTLLVIAPAISICIITAREEQTGFSKISSMIKGYMLLGLLFLLIQNWI